MERNLFSSLYTIISRKTIREHQLYQRKLSLTSNEFDTKQSIQSNPSQNVKDNNNVIEAVNNKTKQFQEKEFAFKMKARRLKVKEVCSRFQETYDER